MAFSIPVIVPYASGDRDSLGYYVQSQPIMAFKELEPDQLRYSIYLASLPKPKPKKQK